MAEFRSFGPELAAFLEELHSNNERSWFAANRERYEKTVREPAPRVRPGHGSGPRRHLPPFPGGRIARRGAL